MRLFIKVFADDLKGPSASYPLQIKGDPSTITLGQLKAEIEQQVKPKVYSKNQILSIKKAPVIVSLPKIKQLQMRINCSDETTLDAAGILEGMKVHLQDEVQISKRSKFTHNYFSGDNPFTYQVQPNSSGLLNSSQLVIS